MAATDQTYRNQHTVDIVFAVSCVLMLVSIVWMFAQDYYREFKVEARRFRDVEAEMFNRLALEKLPPAEQITEAEAAVEAARKGIDQAALAKARNVVADKLPKMAKADAKYQEIKADHDSIESLYNIAVDHHGVDSSEARELRRRFDDLKKRLADQLVVTEAAKAEYDEAQKQVADIEKPLTDALARLKKLNDEFDRAAKNAVQKRWGWGDRFRAFPVIDAFASPTKIQQYTLDALPIDYNFKQVTRYDRCATCHLGLERPAYTKGELRKLREVPKDLSDRLAEAQKLLQRRLQVLAGTGESLGYDPSDLRIGTVNLNEKEINEFAAHPRLDLFVDGNSPHSAEKFGCTICHSGQGSATDFYNASHSPNTPAQKKRWEQDYHWHSNHYWDFPMQPKRFVESSCLKCHHQVTDLIREGNKKEAPKLLRGYELVRDNGCFGCHEIAGIKGGRWVGPDLRLEPYPPLEDLSPAEKARALSDPLNPPGTLRKVGPSLRRLSEKTNPTWVRQWLKSPRDFRPDTKMPHFYGLSNNSPDVLPDEQKPFPDAEIEAITFYLFEKSKEFLGDISKAEKDSPETRRKVQERYQELFTQPMPSDQEQKDKVRAELDELARKLLLWKAAPPIAGLQIPEALQGEELKKQEARGRQLFSERGCLACHIHNGTSQPLGKPGTPGYSPAIGGDAHFAPNLTRVAAKLGTQANDETSARRWLVQWIMNPNVHNPRTYMPITHLTIEQANDIAVWLLSQKSDWKGPEVAEVKLETLQNLARVHLDKILTRRELKELFEPDSKEAEERARARILELKKRGADEGELTVKPDERTLKLYLGRKAINQLGCYACHDIPGFETAKPIGTPLNDWGKKDAERLAFEDIVNYVKKHHYIAPQLTDKEGKPLPVKEVNGIKKTPYDQFFFEALSHFQREGFLHQKLMEPRSYDYNRIRRWDDRLRMPQFRFARTEPRPGESKEDYEARRHQEEAEAREAVMTFILGLVAEPIPAKYVYDPPADRKAEVVGRKVLDKFNCAGCHTVRPGVYEFKPSDAGELLQQAYKTASRTYKDDFHFLNNNAWTGLPPTRPDRLTAYGVRPKVEADPDDPSRFIVSFYLTNALRFTDKSNGKDEARDLRAYSYVRLPLTAELLGSPELYERLVQAGEKAKSGDGMAEAAVGRILQEVNEVIEHKTYGGTFSDLLAKYLMQRDPSKYKPDESDARAAGPPPLIREGEKVQPAWLYQFLRNPGEIRPHIVRDRDGRDIGGITVLRMPKFNLSDDDAMALVNYFAAVDKVNNPAVGLDYPYMSVPQKQEDYLHRMTREYIARLKKDEKQYQARRQAVDRIADALWEDQGKKALADRRRGLEADRDEAKKALDDPKATPEDKKRAQAEVERLDKALEAIKDDEVQKKAFLAAQVRQWETQDAYLADGFRLTASISKTEKLCLNCHKVGELGPRNPQGPNLELAWERLRPEWTERWIANPQRLLPYSTPMPQNMPNTTKPDEFRYQPLFYGNPLEQVIGVRDALMNYPRLGETPLIRRWLTLEGGQ